MDTKAPMTDSGVILSAVDTDFPNWEWGEIDIDRISVAAADLVLSAAIEEAKFQFGTHNTVATAVFSTFDSEVMLEYPLVRMMDYWIEGRTLRDGKVPSHECRDREESEILLRDLEAAAARLRRALS